MAQLYRTMSIKLMKLGLLLELAIDIIEEYFLNSKSLQVNEYLHGILP